MNVLLPRTPQATSSSSTTSTNNDKLVEIIEDTLGKTSLLITMHQQRYPTTLLTKLVEPLLADLRELLNKHKEIHAGEDKLGIELVLLSTITEKLKCLGQAHLCLGLIQLTDNVDEQIQVLWRNDPRFVDYLSVDVIENLSTDQLLKRFFTTGLKNFKPCHFLMKAIPKRVLPIATNKESRESAREFNREFDASYFDNEFGFKNTIRHHEELDICEDGQQVIVKRFRLDTTFGQSINVFKAIVRTKLEEYEAVPEINKSLHIICCHGQESTAAKESAYAVAEAKRYLKYHNEKQVVVIAPDYPASVASGGKISDSIEEMAKWSNLRCIEHLRDCGVEPARIINRGTGLGGLVAAVATDMAAKLGMQVTLISVDSFRRMQEFIGNSRVVGSLMLALWNPPVDDIFLAQPVGRRYCVAKKHDEVLWETGTRRRNRSLYAAVKEKMDPDEQNPAACVLIEEEDYLHGDPLFTLGKNNPVLGFYKRISERAPVSQHESYLTLLKETQRRFHFHGEKELDSEDALTQELFKLQGVLSTKVTVPTEEKCKLIFGKLLKYWQYVNAMPTSGLGATARQGVIYRILTSMIEDVRFKMFLGTHELQQSCIQYYNAYMTGNEKQAGIIPEAGQVYVAPVATAATATTSSTSITLLVPEPKAATGATSPRWQRAATPGLESNAAPRPATPTTLSSMPGTVVQQFQPTQEKLISSAPSRTSSLESDEGQQDPAHQASV